MKAKIPLPTTEADKLIHHLSVCPECRGATRRCPTAQKLIKKTLKERHG